MGPLWLYKGKAFLEGVGVGMNTEIIKQSDLVTYMNGRKIDDY